MILSNDARLEAGTYSEALTAFTVGWTDPANLRELLDFIAPPVPVGRRFEFKKATNAEAFVSETDDIRAIGAAFKRVSYNGDTVEAKTLNKGLTIRVDHDEITGDDWQERNVQVLLQRLYRNELRRAVAALDSVAVNTAVNWRTTTNPDSDLRNALVRGATACGLRPNRILVGETAWDLRSTAYEGQQNAGATGGVMLTPETLARKLAVDSIRVISARYQNTPSSKTLITANQVYAFNAQASYSKDEPSNLKRFITPSETGMFRVYLDETSKYTDITVEHYSTLVATSTIGVEKLTVSP